MIKKYPLLRHFLAARFLFIMAMQMVNTGVGWHLYDITRDPLALGWLGISEVIPAIGLALYAGHYIDTHDKRNVLFRGMSLYLAAALLLAVVTSVWWLAQLSPGGVAWSIYLIIFFTGIFRAFTGPVFAAILAQLVAKTDLAKAVTYSSTAWQAASVAGPVLAGVLISSIGMTVMMSIACVMLGVAVFFIHQLPNLPVQHLKPEQRTLQSVKEGIGFVWRTKEVLSALSVDMFAVLFGGAVAMLPVFAREVLMVDASGMGLLKAAQGIGTVAILFWLTRHPLKGAQGRTMLLHVALFGLMMIVFALLLVVVVHRSFVFGLMMIVFALSKSFWLSFAALLFSGIFDGVSIVVRSTIMQLYVPDDMRGRVSSVNSMFINSSNELGQMESGIAARLMGLVPSVVFGGSITILVVAISWWRAPKLRNLSY